MVAFDLLMSIYQGMLLVFLAHKQFIFKPGSHVRGICCVLSVAAYFSAIQYLDVPVPDSLVIVILFIYVRLFTKDTLTRCILYTVLDGFIFAGTLTLVSYMFGMRIDVNGSVLMSSNGMVIAYSLSANAALTVAVNIAARFSRTDDAIPVKETSIFIVMLLLEFAINEFFFMANEFEHQNTLLILGSISSFATMVLTMLLYEHMTAISEKRRQHELEQKTMLLAQEHQEELKIIYKEMLKQQHDLSHRVNAAYEILSSQGINHDVCSSVKELLGQPQQTRQFFTGSIAVDAVLISKQAVMKNAGISFQFEEYPLPPLPITESDFCVLLSNILDNAIEGVMRLPAVHTSRRIKLTFSKVWEMLFINCTNDADESQINRIGDYFISTKSRSDSHGFGTKSIRKIVEDAGGSVEFDISHGMFTVRIMLGGDSAC